MLDHTLTLALNSLVGRSDLIDAVIVMFERNTLLKGTVLVAPLFGFWFANPGNPARTQACRAKVTATLAAVILSVATVRLIAGLAPFRPRPIFDPSLSLALPVGISREIASRWTAFPSDHAALWFALAGGIATLNRRWGAVALGYALFLSVSRVYIAFHSPSDMAAGAAIALAALWLCHRPVIRARIHAPIAAVRVTHPGFFAMALFVIGAQLGQMFDESRWLARFAIDLAMGTAPAAADPDDH